MSGKVTLFAGDNRLSLQRLIDDGVRVHSVVTDPPYGLTSIKKRFGKEGAAPAKFGTDGAFGRVGAGFMGKQWDGTGIERDPEFWRLIYDILLPGGYVVAFSGARTGHWQACAMEMAGFVMHPMKGWLFGSGFPKAHNAAKAIDRELGTPGSVVAEGKPIKRLIPGAQQYATGDWTKTDERTYQPGTYVPGSNEAAQWEGWAYGGQALKPALEPIYVGQKPFSEKNGALNLLKHGVGAINIDGCRVGDESRTYKGAGASPLKVENHASKGGDDKTGLGMLDGRGGDMVFTVSGRHPANLVHDGSPEVVALFPESKGQQGDVKGTEPSHTGDENTTCYGEFKRVPSPKRDEPVASAARFFNAFPYAEHDFDALVEAGVIDEPRGEPARYQGKAKKSDRAGSKHPTVKPIDLMRWLVRLVTPAGGVVLDPFAGSGTTGAAAVAEGFDCYLMEAEDEYLSDIRRRFGLETPSIDIDDLLGDVSEMDDIAALLG